MNFFRNAIEKPLDRCFVSCYNETMPSKTEIQDMHNRLHPVKKYRSYDHRKRVLSLGSKRMARLAARYNVPAPASPSELPSGGRRRAGTVPRLTPEQRRAWASAILEKANQVELDRLMGYPTPSRQAARIMKKFGGPAELARALAPKRSRTVVYRWLYPRSEGGTDGMIPPPAWLDVKIAARDLGILLTMEDFEL